MKIINITKYIAEDGAEFLDEVRCLQHEAMCSRIDQIMKKLPQLPPDNEGNRFTSGHGYIQHDEATFMLVRTELLHLANEIEPHRWFTDAITKGMGVHASWPGRLIDEMSRPLNRAWYRIMCTDNDFREWGQPYYAAHPEDGTAVQLN